MPLGKCKAITVWVALASEDRVPAWPLTFASRQLETGWAPYLKDRIPRPTHAAVEAAGSRVALGGSGNQLWALGLDLGQQRREMPINEDFEGNVIDLAPVASIKHKNLPQKGVYVGFFWLRQFHQSNHAL